MLAVTWAAPDLELELAPLASETGGPVAVASTPAITGPPLVAWIRQGFNWCLDLFEGRNGTHRNFAGTNRDSGSMVCLKGIPCCGGIDTADHALPTVLHLFEASIFLSIRKKVYPLACLQKYQIAIEWWFFFKKNGELWTQGVTLTVCVGNVNGEGWWGQQTRIKSSGRVRWSVCCKVRARVRESRLSHRMTESEAIKG